MSVVVRVAPAALAIAVAFTVGLGAAPARGADEVGLSRDGVTWGTALEAPLFDAAVRWVPGDRAVETFYVRNQGPTDARMTIDVRTGDPDGLLVEDIALSVRADGGDWIVVRSGQDVAPLLRGALDRRDTVRVDVQVRFRSGSTNRSERDRLPFVLLVTLAQRGRGGGDGPGGDGNLPGTGSAVELWQVLVGAALLGTGVLLVAVRRRREDEDG